MNDKEMLEYVNVITVGNAKEGLSIADEITLDNNGIYNSVKA